MFHYEHNVRFANGDMILLPIPSAELIQREKSSKGKTDKSMNLQYTLVSESVSNQQKEGPENSLHAKKPQDQDFNQKEPTQLKKWLGVPFNHVTDELVAARSHQVRIP